MVTARYSRSTDIVDLIEMQVVSVSVELLVYKETNCNPRAGININLIGSGKNVNVTVTRT